MAIEIVISGISGRFPESDNMAEFSQNLFKKVGLTTECRRWEPGLYGLPKKLGQLKDLSKFDNTFFGMGNKQAHKCDPQLRILLEVTYESIVDAGYDPQDMRSRNVGVFIANSTAESLEIFSNDPKKNFGYAMLGCWRTMLANRISYAFDFKGPSIVLETACSSSASAMHAAVRAINNNECESAIVGSASLCLKPEFSLQLHSINALSADGTCKSFDAAANGFCRSEAIVSLFLQKSCVARRNYASIVHIKTNTDGFKEEGAFLPSAVMQKKLMKEIYDECQLNPLKVGYIEAHGTGTPAGDPVEMSAISEIFCPGRVEPLLVGSVRSNMGHAESSSGLCSVAKLIITMEKSLIPPNLHFYKPNPGIKSLVEGKVKIVTNPTPLEGDYVAMNNFGLGGVNMHIVFKSNTLERKQTQLEAVPIPQLAFYSGRTEAGVQYLFDYLQNESLSREFFALLHKSVYSNAVSKPYRGYKLLIEDQEVSEIKKLTTEERPIWYVFSGMGCQWPCMAKQLMNLELFANSIRRSAKVLMPYGLDLIDLLTNEVKNERDSRSTVPPFVCIGAVQIALVDVLNEIGITPDGMVGHSLGELGCAYADGSFSAEQMLLSAYWRGKVVDDSNIEGGAMAAIGLTWSQASKRCPKGVFPSCHNAEDSLTVSGPKDSVKGFIDMLKAENVFVREVDSCGYAFHSQYVFPMAGKLQSALEKVIPNPKLRKSIWISSSYPKEEWNTTSSKLADAAYFVHNLVSPVLFYEALTHVPKNAIVIEIGPHHLLQPILKRVIGPASECIGLMKRNVNNTVQLLSSLGRLYITGKNPEIEKLYPKVLFPVPKGTPMISPLIKWDHSESWIVAKWDKNTNLSNIITEVNIGSDKSPDKYLLDHSIDGKFLYPATGYMVLVWKAFAEIKSKDFRTFPVTFEEIKFHRATLLSKAASTKFLVEITKVGGEFEISEGGRVVCSGRIYSIESGKTDASEFLKSSDITSYSLNQNDIYKQLNLRGYNYGPTFQGLTAADIEGNKGILKWTGEWVVFLDTMLQFLIYALRKGALHIPNRIQSIKIDPIFHKSIMDSVLREYNGFPVFHDKNTNQVISGGVEVKHLEVTLASRKQAQIAPLLEYYSFIPYNETNILSKSAEITLSKYTHACSSLLNMILKFSRKNEIKPFDVINEPKADNDALIESYLKSCSDKHVLLKSLCEIMKTATSKDFSQHVKNYINRYLCERDYDLLSQTMLEENPLRTVMDVVLENVSSRNLKIAEIAETFPLLSMKLNEVFRTLGVLNVDYLIAHSIPSLFDKIDFSSGNYELSSWDQNSPLAFTDVDVCVMKFLTHPKKILKNVLPILKDHGFILLLQRTRLLPVEICISDIGGTILPIHSETDLEYTFKDLNLQIICKKSDSFTSTMYLLRKSVHLPYEDIVIPVMDNKYEKWVDELSKNIKIASMSSESKRIWLVSEDSHHTGIIGLVNCLRKEPGGSSVRCVFISERSEKFNKFSFKNLFYQDVIQKNLTMNVLRRGAWGSFRHLKMSDDSLKVETKHAYLNILTRGDLSSFAWVLSPMKYFKQSADRTLCQVYYSSLNFKDVMIASGKLTLDVLAGDLATQECLIGVEFSGRLENGQRVMGIVPSQGIATTVAVHPNFLWEVPNDWSLEEASTVPVVYSTAYFALIIKGNLRKGERILIHAGSGGVGQAAIAIALSLGCEVFTTIGSSEKVQFLKTRFRELQDRNFCYSRDTSFEKHILNETHGQGVDVVLNSLADDKLKASLNCLARYGRFLEIGKFDMSKNTPLGMNIFMKGISFIGIHLDYLIEDESDEFPDNKEIVQLIKAGILNGTVKPLNCKVFNYDEAEKACRFMINGKHIGKVVLKIKDEELQKTIVPTSTKINALNRTICDPEKSYVIIGGLGGFGLELCQWLVDRGARYVVLTSRSGLKTGYQKLCMNRWKLDNRNIIVSELNVTKLEEAKALLKMVADIKPVAAVFNLALVLRDALMENQSVQMFKEVCESKVTSTLNLDAVSRELCPQLDWFVCFSSLSCGRGNAGQSNYGYANSVMERVCEGRLKEGLPGLAIQWGAIGDVGVIQDTLRSDFLLNGVAPQPIRSCLMVLDKFLQQKHPVLSSFIPYQPFLSTTKKDSKRNIMTTVSNIFGIKDMSALNPAKSLGELGMDSLISVEIKQLFEREYDLVLSLQELRQMKIKDLKKLEGFNEETKVITDFKFKVKSNSDTTYDSDTETVEKASIYFVSQPSNQLVPAETIIKMNSIKTGTPLVLIHPIEGNVSMLYSLAKRIHFPVFGIQCTPEAPSESIEQLAAWYWKHIKTLNVNDTIFLAGYSFGVSVAFEIGLQAERDPQQQTKIQKLIMLDGSPAFVFSFTQEYKTQFQGDTSAVFEAQVLCSYVMQFMDINMMEFKKEMVSLSSFADRIKKSVEKIITTYNNFQTEDLTQNFHLYYKKLQMLNKYIPRDKLQIEVTLFKASDGVFSDKNISETCDFEKICDGKIAVHTVKGSHKTFVLGKGAKEISNLLNDILSH